MPWGHRLYFFILVFLFAVSTPSFARAAITACSSEISGLREKPSHLPLSLVLKHSRREPLTRAEEAAIFKRLTALEQSIFALSISTADGLALLLEALDMIETDGAGYKRYPSKVLALPPKKQGALEAAQWKRESLRAIQKLHQRLKRWKENPGQISIDELNAEALTLNFNRKFLGLFYFPLLKKNLHNTTSTYWEGFFELYMEWEEIDHRFILDNVPLAASIVSKKSFHNLAKDDALLWSMAILSEATKEFDPRKKLKFSTFFTTKLKRALDEMASEVAIASIPKGAYQALWKLRRLEHDLAQKLNREPSIEELAHKANLTQEKAEELFKLETRFSRQRSLDDRGTQNNQLNLLDRIDDSDLSPVEHAVQKESNSARERIMAAIEILRRHPFQPNTKLERNIEILLYSYGLHPEAPGKEFKVTEVAKIFKINRQRVGGIVSDLLEDLREIMRLNNL